MCLCEIICQVIQFMDEYLQKYCTFFFTFLALISSAWKVYAKSGEKIVLTYMLQLLMFIVEAKKKKFNNEELVFRHRCIRLNAVICINIFKE